MNLIDIGNIMVLVEGGLNPDQAKRVSDQWRAKCAESDQLRKALQVAAADLVGCCKNPEDSFVSEAVRRISDAISAADGSSK